MQSNSSMIPLTHMIESGQAPAVRPGRNPPHLAAHGSV